MELENANNNKLDIKTKTKQKELLKILLPYGFKLVQSTTFIGL